MARAIPGHRAVTGAATTDRRSIRCGPCVTAGRTQPSQRQCLWHGGSSMTEAETPSSADGAPVPRVLCNTESLIAADSTPAGALWRLAEPGRQLDANLVRIPPGGRIGTHTEPDLDVLLLVVVGDGTLGPAADPQPLADGSLVWLPRGSSRGLIAGSSGLSYVTVHRRRPGVQIGTRPSS